MHKNLIFPENVLAERRPAAVFRVTGEDAFTFIQGQFTNELRQGPGSATYGLWLNQKGKVLADSLVLRIAENELLIVSEGSQAAVIRQRLEDYIIADDVTLTDETAGWTGMWVAGPGAELALARVSGELPAAGKFLRHAAALILRSRHGAGTGFEILGPAELLEGMRQRFLSDGFIMADSPRLEFARISAGIPSIPVDLGAGDLPNEGGLDETAISYTKGCYLGQEVMARLKNLGQVRRRLHVVRGRGQPPASLASLYQADKRVGEIRSVAAEGDEFVALAMLSLVNFQPEAGGLSLEPGGPAALTVDRHG